MVSSQGSRGAQVDKCVPAQLQRLFVLLQTSDERDVETTELTSAFGWNDADAYQQQDVQELFALLTDAIEEKFKVPARALVRIASAFLYLTRARVRGSDAAGGGCQGTPQAGIVRALYEGSYEDGVTCKECNTSSPKIEQFQTLVRRGPLGARHAGACLTRVILDRFHQSISRSVYRYSQTPARYRQVIPIKAFGDPEPIKSIEQGLHKYFEAELLEGANQYSCEKCEKNCDAMKGLKLTKVPSHGR